MVSLWDASDGWIVHGSHVHAFSAPIPGTAKILPLLSVCTDCGPDSPDHTFGFWAASEQAKKVADGLASQLVEHRRAFVCLSQLDGLEIQVSPHHQLIVFNDLGTTTV